MSAEPVLVRDFIAKIGDGGDPETYTEIKGLTSLQHSPSSETADATTFSSAGRSQQMTVSRGDSYTLTGLRLESETDGTRDPGQEAVENAAQEIGQAAFASYEIEFPGGGRLQFTATAEVTRLGGGVNDLSTWEATLNVYGTPVWVPPT